MNNDLVFYAKKNTTDAPSIRIPIAEKMLKVGV